MPAVGMATMRTRTRRTAPRRSARRSGSARTRRRRLWAVRLTRSRGVEVAVRGAARAAIGPKGAGTATRAGRARPRRVLPRVRPSPAGATFAPPRPRLARPARAPRSSTPSRRTPRRPTRPRRTRSPRTRTTPHGSPSAHSPKPSSIRIHTALPSSPALSSTSPRLAAQAIRNSTAARLASPLGGGIGDGPPVVRATRVFSPDTDTGVIKKQGLASLQRFVENMENANLEGGPRGSPPQGPPGSGGAWRF